MIRGRALAARRLRSNPRALTALAVTGAVVLAGAVGLLFVRRSGTDAGQESVQTDSQVGNAAATTAPPTTTTMPPTTTTRPPRDLGKVLLVGDSVAWTLADALTSAAAARGIPFTAAAIPGCGMISGLPAAGPGLEPVSWAAKCERVVVDQEKSLAASRDAGTVLWLSTWENADRWIDGTLHPFGTPETDALILDLMDQARARLLTNSDALLVLVKAAPSAVTSQVGLADPENVKRTVHLNHLYDQFAKAHPIDTRVLDLASMICPYGPPCPAVVDGFSPRPKDGGHFSTEGAAWLAPRFLDQLASVAG